MKVWIKYDDSPERLPVCIADTAFELARLTGESLGTIYSYAYKMKHGEVINGKIACVEIDEGEET